MAEIDEIESPFLRSLINERGGEINDDLRNLISFERRLHRPPQSARMIFRLASQATASRHPVEAAIIRKELELGRALTNAELEEAKTATAASEAERYEVQVKLAGKWRSFRLR